MGTLMCVITPDGSGAVMRGSTDLDTLQALVGGLIEEVFPSTGNLLGWHGYVNEDGKMMNLPFNAVATHVATGLGWTPLPGDFLVGPLVLLGDATDGEEGDLPLAIVEAIDRLYNEATGLDKEDTATTS